MSLAAENLSFAYRAARPVLKGVSVEFGNPITAIIGPNGAGKSTLLRLLAGVASGGVREGKVTLDGQELLDLRAVERVRRLAMLAQVPAVSAPLTVGEVVMLGRTLLPSDPATVARAIEEVGLNGRENDLFESLSVGERQLAAFARVLAQLGFEQEQRPRYLLADEPIAALDPNHAVTNARRIRAASERGIRCVLVVHDLDFVSEVADRVIGVGRCGSVVADGPPEQTLKPDVLESLYGCRFGVGASVAVRPDYGGG